ncbi:MAG: S-layer homology domain-containing protein [Oscillospiraceae bacterium]
MKTLSKTLSLVLVFVMVLGMFGVSGATYTDNDEISYKEAADVMTAIGVFNGIGGEFQPQGKLTREQAAKIICYLTIGQVAADNLTATEAPFTDVAADRWSAGSISYCVKQGIIAGHGDGTFDPEGYVTGYQFAKMLLVALGYDAIIEQFIGPSWAINVAKRAFANDLFSGNDSFAGDKAATREEAALYALNLLECNTVSYAYKGTNIISNGITISIGASAPSQANPSFMATYYKGLAVDHETTDAFGRSATVWTLKGGEIGTYADKADFTFTSDKTSTAGVAELKKLFKGYSFASLDRSNVSYNGKPEGTSGTVSSINSAAALAAITGNGVIVEVFTADDNSKTVEAISVIETDLAKINGISAASKKVSLVTVSTNTAGSATYTITEDNSEYANVYELSVGDYVLVVPVWNGSDYSVHSAVRAKTVSGHVNATNALTSTVYLDGTAYVKGSAKTSAVDSIAVDTTNEATLWLDSHGYIVHADTATATTTNYIYVLEAYQSLSSEGKLLNMAKGVLTDGSIVDVVTSTLATAGKLYGSVVSNDVYALTESTALSAAGTAGDEAVVTANKHIALKSGGTINSYDKVLTSATQTGNHYGNYYDTDVKFIFVSSSAKTATVKTGVQGVASIPAGSFAVVEAKSASDSTPVVKAVVLVDGIAASVDSDSLIYFPSSTPIGSTALKNETTGKYETFNVYAGYIDGVLVEGGVATKSSVSANSFYTFAKSEATGAYVLASSAYSLTSGNTAVQTAQSITATFDSKLITVNSLLLDISKAVVTDVRSDSDKAAEPVIESASGLCEAADSKTVTVSVIYNATTGSAETVYILSVA